MVWIASVSFAIRRCCRLFLEKVGVRLGMETEKPLSELWWRFLIYVFIYVDYSRLFAEDISEFSASVESCFCISFMIF